MLRLSYREEEALLKQIPTRGHYESVQRGGFWNLVWRHGTSERTLVQFLGPHAGRLLAVTCNFVHQDQKTGETMRNWEMLKKVWWDGRKSVEQPMVVLAR